MTNPMTPTEQDKELREAICNAMHIHPEELQYSLPNSFGKSELEAIMQLITADRKRVALEEVRNAKIVHVEMHHTDKGQFDDWCFKRQQEINDGVPPKYRYEAPPNGFASWQQFEAGVEAAYRSQFTESELKAQQVPVV